MMVFTELLKKHNRLQPKYKPDRIPQPDTVTLTPPVNQNPIAADPAQLPSVPAPVLVPAQAAPPTNSRQASSSRPSTSASTQSARSGTSRLSNHSFSAKLLTKNTVSANTLSLSGKDKTLVVSTNSAVKRHKVAKRATHTTGLENALKNTFVTLQTQNRHIGETTTSGVRSFSNRDKPQKSNSGGLTSMVMPSDFEHLYHAPSNISDAADTNQQARQPSIKGKKV